MVVERDTKWYFGLAGNIFCIPGFENVSPEDGSDWVKETHCALKAEWKFIFLWFYEFLFLLFIIFYVLNFFRIAK